MILTHDLIEKNIKTYNDAREIFPIIIDYENKIVSRLTMSKVGLVDFADFYDFILKSKTSGFELVEKITYRKLKSIIIENTTTERFKTYIKNRTQKQFIEICNDYKKFDRLLQGRVISRSRRRINRSREKIEGLMYSILPLLNYLISNEIEFTYHIFDDIVIRNDVRWYINSELKYDNAPVKEIELTKGIINVFDEVLEETQIDFRKLNLDYITDSLVTKLRELMVIPKGTNIKSIETINKLTKNNFYTVDNYYLQQGHLKVMVRNDEGISEWYNYSSFEDMSIKRNELLSKLLG